MSEFVKGATWLLDSKIKEPPCPIYGASKGGWEWLVDRIPHRYDLGSCVLACTIIFAMAYDRKGSEPRTDFLIVDKSSGQHKHVSVDQYGNITEHHDYR